VTACATDLALERFLLDELDAAADRAHILGCARCRAALADKQRLGDAYMASREARELAQLLVPAPDTSPRPRSRTRLVITAAAAALAAALLVVFWHPATADTREAEVRTVQRAWMNAYLHNDEAALDAILADDYRLTTSAGDVTTKADDLAAARAKRTHLDTYDTSNVQVHISGDTAVITGRTQIHGHRAGRPFAHEFMFTDTLARIDGRWRAVEARTSRTSPP
jgi:ketosteroid isomerase-like protein